MLISNSERLERSVYASEVSRTDGPFVCPECNERVYLRVCATKRDHFYHAVKTRCSYGTGESAVHQAVKTEIYEACKKSHRYSRSILEYQMKEVGRKPDVLVQAKSTGRYFAVEVQISKLQLETIEARTRDLSSPSKGPTVLWLSYRPDWLEENIRKSRVSEVSDVERFYLSLAGHFLVWAGGDRVQVWVRRGRFLFFDRVNRICDLGTRQFDQFRLAINPRISTPDLVRRTRDGVTYAGREDALWSLFLDTLGIQYRYERHSISSGPQISKVFFLPDIKGGFHMATPDVEDLDRVTADLNSDLLEMPCFPDELLKQDSFAWREALGVNIDTTRWRGPRVGDYSHFFCQCSCGEWSIQYCGQMYVERMSHACTESKAWNDDLQARLRSAFQVVWDWKRKSEWAENEVRFVKQRFGDGIFKPVPVPADRPSNSGLQRH